MWDIPRVVKEQKMLQMYTGCSRNIRAFLEIIGSKINLNDIKN